MKTEFAKISKKSLLNLFLSITFVLTTNVLAQENNLMNKDQIFDLGKFQSTNYNIGIELSQTPRSITGEEVSLIPMVHLNYSMSLPNIRLNTGISSCYLINLAKAGFNYSVFFSGFNFNPGLNMKYWFGTAQMKGFNSFATGLIASPNINFDFMALNTFFNASVESDIFITKTYKYGKKSFSDSRFRFQGISFSLKIEKPITNSMSITATGKLSITEPNHLTWLVNPSSSQKVIIPSLAIGFAF